MPAHDLPEGLAADLEGEPFDGDMTAWADRLPGSLLDVVAHIAERGAGVWLVGGSVREALLGRGEHDYDLAVTLTPDEMLSLFPRSIPTGVAFGTVTLRTNVPNSDGRPNDDGEATELMFEATTLRTESEYGDGRRPDEVAFGSSLATDLSRRDLTINSIAVDLARRQIHDPFAGSADLTNRNLRAVGDAAHRLSEDGLRIMRAYRFMDQGEAGVWLPDKQLADAMVSCAGMLDNVAAERIWHEFSRILSGVNAGQVLARMEEDGVLSRLLPGWPSLAGPQNELGEVNPTWLAAARLAMLACGAEIMRWRLLDDDLRVLKVPNQVRQRVLLLHKLLGTLPPSNDEASLRLYRAASGEAMLAHLAIEAALDPDGNSKVVHECLDALPELGAGTAPLIDGNTLSQQTGLAAGVRLGRLKSWLHRIQIEGDVKDAADLLTMLDVLPWQEGDCDDWPTVAWP